MVYPLGQEFDGFETHTYFNRVNRACQSHPPKISSHLLNDPNGMWKFPTKKHGFLWGCSTLGGRDEWISWLFPPCYIRLPLFRGAVWDSVYLISPESFTRQSLPAIRCIRSVKPIGYSTSINITVNYSWVNCVHQLSYHESTIKHPCSMSFLVMFTVS